MPAGSTYTPIATATLGSATASYTFSSISGAYTDLVLIINGYGDGSDGNSIVCRVGNGTIDTGNNYSTTRLHGSGSAVGSGRASDAPFMRLANFSGMSTSSANPTLLIANFMNYSNTSTYKTILNRINQVNGSYPGVEALVNSWRSTSAINTIEVYPYSSSFATGTTLTLYGITAA